METKTESAQPILLKCKQCGGTLQLLYTILDSISGKQVRAFKCLCGERTVGN
jgi:hypothetical protein